LWNNPETKPLIIDLIKHSYVGTGFFTGLNSFHSLIPLDILAEINYNKYRQDKLAKLANGNILFDEDTEDRIIDQLIRNFPKDFTQVFEKSMFKEKDKVLYTNDDMIKIAKRASGMFIGRDEEGETIYPTYIRVYDKGIKRSLIYKQTDKGKYHYVTSLGKPGKLIEINTEADIEKSILRDNNSTTKKSTNSNESTFTVNSTPEDLNMMGITNDPLDMPVLETNSFGAVDPSQVQDLSIFGDIKPPSEDDIKTTGIVDTKPQDKSNYQADLDRDIKKAIDKALNRYLSYADIKYLKIPESFDEAKREKIFNEVFENKNKEYIQMFHKKIRNASEFNELKKLNFMEIGLGDESGDRSWKDIEEAAQYDATQMKTSDTTILDGGLFKDLIETYKKGDLSTKEKEVATGILNDYGLIEYVTTKANPNQLNMFDDKPKLKIDKDAKNDCE